MKTEKYDGAEERQILIGMITSTPVLAKIAPKWQRRGMFASAWPGLVGSWCVDYFNTYGKAPNKNIEGLFATWAKTARSKDMVKLVEGFLSGLSAQYAELRKKINSDYLVDQAATYFRKVRAIKTSEAIAAHVAAGDLDAAEQEANSLSKLELGPASWIDVLRDKAAIERAFTSKSEPMLKFRAGMGEFFGDACERDAFICVVGGPGVGKSWILQEICYQALLERKRTVMFQLGDMSEAQIMRRFMIRIARKPLRPGKVLMPKHIGFTDGECIIEHDVKEYPDPLDEQAAWEACQRLIKTSIRSSEPLLRLNVRPNFSATVLDVIAQLRELSRQKTAPDVCIASGSQVLTDRGLVPIENITNSHRLWDGRSWVNHGGLVYKGERDVIQYAGLTATPEHLVYTEQGWRTVELCRRLGLRVARTGNGRQEVQLGEDYISDHPSEKSTIQKERAQLYLQAEICLCPVCSVQVTEMGIPEEFNKRNLQGVPGLSSAEAVSYLSVQAIAVSPAALSEQEPPSMAALWCQRNKIQIQNGNGSLCLDSKELRATQKGHDTRPYRQRRSLSSRQFTLVNAPAEYFTHKKKTDHHNDAQISAVISQCQICRRYFEKISEPWYVACSDQISMEVNKEKVCRLPVWDVVNSGPLHRFTVQGILAHNCVLDYPDLLLPPNSKYRDDLVATDDTWKYLRSIPQEFHCLLFVATQASTESFGKHTMDKKHVRGNKLKAAHVTGLIGINQTDAEKEQGLYRLNWMKLRDQYFLNSKCCFVASCLPLANPCVKSIFPA
jgi:hypothetical protein